MNFETETDCIYFLSWCALAPFCGIFPFRPSDLITGPSGVGKSTIFANMAKPLTLSFAMTVKESSSAGCRQKNGNNSEGIILEEADAKDYDEEKKRKDFFSLMRISFQEDSPDAYKGTAGHVAVNFKMKSMFMFISISPIVGDIADDNRLFPVNLKAKNNKDEWEKIEIKIDELLTEENCKSIRALTWSRLHEIIELAKKLKPILQNKIGMDSRRSHAEGLMIAAYYLIWYGAEKVDIPEIENIIDRLYEKKPAIEKRNQADEIITRILDEQIPIDGYRNKITLREAVQAVSTGRLITGSETDINGEEMIPVRDLQKLKNTLGRYGLGVIETTNLAIAFNHHEIMKIITMGNGYHQHLWRHPGLQERSRNVSIGGKTRRCVIISGVIDDIPF